MAQITIGLAPHKSGFYDPLTNLYLTLETPIKALELAPFDPKKDLKNIVASLLGDRPGLVLYEGIIPEEAVEVWKEKYAGMLKAKPTQQRGLLPEHGIVTKQGKYAYDRANALNANAVMELSVDAAAPEVVVAPEPAPEEAVKEVVEEAAEEQVEEQADLLSGATDEQAAPTTTRRKKS
jgi:hypothetical protein